jgi:hypothetical protein
MNNFSVASSVVHSVKKDGGSVPIQLFGYISDIPKESGISNKQLENEFKK